MKNMYAFFLVFFFCVCVSGQKPNDIDWVQKGPGAGGNHFYIACAPANPDFVYMLPDIGGIYFSGNGGEDWERKAGNFMRENRGYGFGFVAIAPSNPNVAYTFASHMIWDFFKGGKQGNSIVPPETALLKKFNGKRCAGIIKTEDCGKTWKVICGTANMLGGIAVDPENESVLWAASGNSTNKVAYYPLIEQKYTGAVSSSSDGGKTWFHSYPASKNAEEAVAKKIAFGNIVVSRNSPKKKRTLYICGNQGVFRSSDHGRTWTNVSGNLPHHAVEQLDLFDSPDGKNHIVVAALREKNGEWGIFRMKSHSGIWENISANLKQLTKAPAGFRYVLISKQNPDIIYAAPGSGVSSNGTYARQKGVFKTVDGGKSWKNISRAWSLPRNKEMDGVWNLSRGYGDIAEGLSLSAQNDKILYMADGGCMLYKTTDGGDSWKLISSKRLADGSYKTRGVESICVLDLAFSQNDPNKIYMAENDFALLVSENNGDSWFNTAQEGINRTAMPGAPRDAFPRAIGTTSVASLPGTNIVFAGVHGWSSEGFNGLFCRSEDGGKNWKTVSREQGKEFLPKNAGGTYNRHLLSILPFSETHILITKRTGLFESVDGGKSWTRIENGIPDSAFHRFYRLFRDPLNPDRIYAASALFPPFQGTTSHPTSRVNGQHKIPEGFGGLYRSDDKGKNWIRMTKSPEMDNAVGFAISPDGKTMFLGTKTTASCWGKPEMKFYPGALYRSTDKGASWTKVLFGRNRPDAAVRSVAIHPLFPNLVYAIGEEIWGSPSYSDVFRSTDGGETWQQVTGNGWHVFYNILAINPARPDSIYLGTAGAALFIGRDPYLIKKWNERKVVK